MYFISSTVIQDIEAICKAGNASMAYFYSGFRDANKQSPRDLLLSFLVQTSASSNPRCDIVSDLYFAHDERKKQPSDTSLVECLKEMLALLDQCPTYLIIDALDESSNTSGTSSPRDRVLEFVQELVELRLPDLRICHESPRSRYLRCSCTSDLSQCIPSQPEWSKERYRGVCKVDGLLEFGTNHEEMDG